MTKSISMTSPAALAAVWLFTLGACSAGDGTPSELGEPVGEIEAPLVSNCASGKLGAAINAHTCQHGSLGPFGNVTATVSPGSAPAFDGIHKYFTVDFEDATSTYVGYVNYTPANNDDHAVYFHPSATVTVKDSGGTTVSPQLSQTVSTCGGYLTGYRVFSLSSSGAPYSIKFESNSATIYAALEEVTPYRERWYQDADSDTWGKPSPSILTACEPPSGYNVTRGGDCNDASASINPTASEIAGDGIDSNCNGNDNT
jgi:hypothetical protein